MNRTELILHRLGFRSTYKGFRYLCHAIELALEDDAHLTRLTKGLYPAVARRCGASAPAVERSLRTLIDVFWVRGNLAFFQEITCYPLRDKPYTGEFIAILVCYLKNVN